MVLIKYMVFGNHANTTFRCEEHGSEKVESAANYVEVKEGALHKKRYFVPKYYIDRTIFCHMAGDLTKSMSVLWRVLFQNMLRLFLFARNMHMLLNLVCI
jgi:hypothetical protein